MGKFIISGFADEIAPELDKQMMVLKKLGIGFAELRGIDGKNVSDYTAEEMKTVKKSLDKGGIRVSSIGSPIGKIGIDDDFDVHMKKLENTIELAKILETENIRVFSFYIPNGESAEKYRDDVLRRMEKMTAAAKRAGVRLLHENEKGIYGDTAKRCADILESVGSDSLAAVFDPANFVQCGQKTYPDAYEMLKPYIIYMHIKDAKSDGSVVPAGSGCGEVEKIISALDAAGYEGFLSLEPHLADFAGFDELEKDGSLEKLPEGGEKTFTVAYNALKKILDNIKQ